MRVERCALLLQLGELAGQHQAQFGPHLLAQLGVTLRLRRLALERIHLPRDFLENVIHAGQVQLGVFQTRFRQPLLGFEFGDAGSFFDDGPAVGGTAAQDLPDASLLDQRVGLRAQPGTHEQFLDIAQAAQLAVQQIFAFAGAEQPPVDHDLPSLKLLLELCGGESSAPLGSGSATALQSEAGRPRPDARRIGTRVRHRADLHAPSISSTLPGRASSVRRSVSSARVGANFSFVPVLERLGASHPGFPLRWVRARRLRRTPRDRSA